VISALIILIPGAPLILISIWSQVLNGILLPVVLVSMILLINNKKIMGNYVNNRLQNFIGWTAVLLLVGLSLTLLFIPLFNN
jgi:Mn2+/Fe2+ NRAMP family transporter